jgi:hypothetical protein
MKPITTNDELAEHSRMLESDLDSLFKLVFTHRKPLAEGDIRLASVILRKWLTDGLLGHYCHVAGVVVGASTLNTRLRAPGALRSCAGSPRAGALLAQHGALHES